MRADGFFVFEQPGRVEYAAVTNSPTEWDYAGFLEMYGMSATNKTASTYIIVAYDGTD